MNGHAIYCGNERRWPGVGAASPDRGVVITCARGITNAHPVHRPVLRMRKIPVRVSKGNPLARDCIQSVTCLRENKEIALSCTKSL